MEMEKLPTEIASNILSRLPFDSVMQFKCVSKYWYNLHQLLIHTSGELYFAQNHRSRLMENYNYTCGSSDSDEPEDDDDDDEYFSTSSSLPDSVLLMLDQSNNKLDVDDDTNQHLLLHYADYNENQKMVFNCNQAVYCKAVKKLNCPLPLDVIINSKFWTMSTSSNGLLCSLVIHNSSYLFCIYNPFLGDQYVILPDDDDAQMQISSCTMAFGFGHVPSTNEYKVVRIVYPPPGGSDDIGNIEVYTLGGGGKWTSKGNIKRRLQCDSPGVLVNGSLHWLTEDNDGEKIIVFNLLEEEFDHMIEPPQDHHPNFKIKEWEGCLWGLSCTDEDRFHYTWKFSMVRPHSNSKNKVIVDGVWDKISKVRWRGEGKEGIQHYEQLFFYNKASQALLWTSCISTENKKLYKYNTSAVVAMKMGHLLYSGRWRQIWNKLRAAKLFHGIFHIKSFVSLKALGENNIRRIKMKQNEAVRQQQRRYHDHPAEEENNSLINLKKLKS